MSSDALKQGIQVALGAPCQRRQPTAQDISQEASEARVALEANMGGMVQINIPSGSERNRATFQLLRASMDYGRALLFLLETHPIDLSAVALGLHRSQTEQFLRAVFVQFIADEEQFQDFFREDRGPRQKNDKGKWVAIPLNDLAAKVETICPNRPGQRPAEAGPYGAQLLGSSLRAGPRRQGHSGDL